MEEQGGQGGGGEWRALAIFIINLFQRAARPVDRKQREEYGRGRGKREEKLCRTENSCADVFYRIQNTDSGYKRRGGGGGRRRVGKDNGRVAGFLDYFPRRSLVDPRCAYSRVWRTIVIVRGFPHRPREGNETVVSPLRAACSVRERTGEDFWKMKTRVSGSIINDSAPWMERGKCVLCLLVGLVTKLYLWYDRENKIKGKKFDKNIYIYEYFTINCDVFLSNKNIYSIYQLKINYKN